MTFHVATFHLQETGLHRRYAYLYKQERKASRHYSQRAKRQSGERLRIATSSVTKICPVHEETVLVPYPGQKSLKLFPQLPRKGWTMFKPFQATANNLVGLEDVAIDYLYI